MARVPIQPQFDTSLALAKDTKKGGASKAKGVKSGQLGERYDGKLGGAEGTVETMLSLVEFDGVQAVTVQLWQENGLPRDAITMVPTPDLAGTLRSFNFDAATEEEDPGGLAAGAFRLSNDKQSIYISKTALSPGFDLATEYATATKLKIDKGAGFFIVQIDEKTERTDDWEITLVAPGATGASLPSDGAVTDLIPLTPQPDSEVIPNASARARIRTRAGQSNAIEFDCDWEGSFEVVAQSIEIERVSFRPSRATEYVDATVKLVAALTLGGKGQRIPPQYTEPPEAVAATGSRDIMIPQFARRVSLLMKYGDGSSGDAPLALIFVAFRLPFERSQGFIDALSARGALFGEGLPIPHGANSIKLTNMSADPVDLGLVFHLGV